MSGTQLAEAGLDEPVAVDRSGSVPAAIAPSPPPLRLVEDLPSQPVSDRAGADGHSSPSRSLPTAAGRMSAFGWWSRLISRSATTAACEVVATAAAVVSAPLGLAGRPSGTSAPRVHPPAARVPGRTAPPVVLVHGFAASQTCWFALRRALRTDGQTVHTFNYSPWASSVDELADRLTEYVEDVRAATGASKVHLVGHSLGGVIIAQALTRRRLARHVDLVVTLGSPFGGSPWADLLPIGPLVRALRPGSPLLQRLAAAPPPAGVRWLAFGSTLDPIVPADRAVPANPLVERVTIDAAGHSGMLLAPDVIARVVAAITGADTAPDTGDLLAG
jgi:triacylglycerol lipase